MKKPCPAWPLYLISFWMDVVMGMTGLAFPWLAQHRFRASADTIGAIASLTTALYTAMALGTGIAARYLTPYRRMAAAAIIAAGCYLMIAVTESLAVFVVSLALVSLVMGAFWPALQTQLTAGCEAEEIQRRAGRFNVAWSFGYMLGPALAGYVYSRISPEAPYLASTAVTLFVAGLVAITLFGKTAAADAAVGASREHPAGIAGFRGIGLFLLAAWCAHFGSYFCASNVRNFFPVLATARGIPHWVQGLLGLELGIFQTISFFWMTRAKGWVTRRTTSMYGMILVIAGMLLAAQATVPFFMMGFALAGFGFGVTYVVSIYHSLHSTQPARNSGIHEGIVGGSGIFGAGGGGLVAARYGLQTPFYLCSAVVVVTLVVSSALFARSTPWADDGGPETKN